ncbi:MAG: type I polyketide synthase [Terriglobales bacterium]
MNGSAIAIVGMACHFPGARNVEEFWANLRAGREAIRALSEEELLAAGVSRRELANPDYVRAAAMLDDVDKFDAPFFGMSPRDAAIMDPQHRHFLECAWEALENAGHVPGGQEGAIGVFAGSGMNGYLIHNLLANPALAESTDLFLLRHTGNDTDVLATRVSYQFDLHGPSLSVQTACSTSLVAVHLACQSLLSGECDLALAGGVTIEVPHGRGYVHRDGGILSRDGHCRAFDAGSSGTVFSSGAGVVVLRRLADARAEGDSIHALILGSAINNDGARKIGFFAPSVEGQVEVIADALEVAGVGAAEISYVETHGTGTAIGDPIEIQALAQAFRRSNPGTAHCAIGSLKASVGHMDAAAGIGGLIKTVLALEHRELPPSLHFRTANPLIRIEETPFVVNAALRAWTAEGPRRAGVTSLGVGGTNAHVVLEEAPTAACGPGTKPFQVLIVSAKTEPAVACAATNLAHHLESHAGQDFADAAFTLQTGRKEFRCRRALVAAGSADAAAALWTDDPKRVWRGTAPRLPPPVIFLFSGQGSQHGNMGADLYASQPVFRAALDRCAELLRPQLDLDLRALLYPAGSESQAAAARLNQTGYAQPALFAVAYALAQLWQAWGVRPRAMLGHSIGEYVAACLAGVFPLEEALALIALRGRLMQQMAPGAMLSVALPASELELRPPLSLAAINGPDLCVVSGPCEAISAAEKTYAAREAACRRLHTSHAFHSAMMEPMLAEWRERLDSIRFLPPQIPYLSNLTGKWITAEEATNPDYWVRHVRQTVRFSDNLAEVFRLGASEQADCILLEAGPGQALTALARLHPQRGRAKVFASCRHPREPVSDLHFLLGTLAQLWVAGQPVPWDALHAGESRRRIPLPTYPFEHQRYWFEPGPPATREAVVGAPRPDAHAAASPASSGLPAPASAQHDVGSWFQQRVWRKQDAPAGAARPGPADWLIFDDETGLGDELLARLAREGDRAVRVVAGKHYRRLGAREYAIRPGVRADCDLLLADLETRGATPQKIVHLWMGLDLDSELTRGFYSLLSLAQAMGDRDVSACAIAVVSRGLHAVAPVGGAVAHPAQALLLGPVRVIPRELPGISCRNIDLELSTPHGEAANQIVTEMSMASRESVIAYRGNARWAESFGPLAAATGAARSHLREHGVYFITGGLGGIGLVIAEALARECKAKLVLASRTGIATTGRLSERLAAIEALGGEVLTVRADVTRRGQLRVALRAARKRFGAIHGVIHAAGVLEDAPLQLKTRESAARVLAPKLQGTVALEEELRDYPLDFLALFSSISSIAPPPGQVDYAAANAFLDAFAQTHRDRRVVSINWGRWEGVGMSGGTAPPRAGSEVHPLLGRCVSQTPEEATFDACLTCAEHWILGEHTLRGTAGGMQDLGVLPGTGYLEMAAAAYHRAASRRPPSTGEAVEFSEVFFFSPLACEKSGSTDVRIRLRREGMAMRFSVLSQASGWVENASGLIARAAGAPPPNQEIAAIRARCCKRVLRFHESDRTRQEQYFAFGPRWRSLRTLHLGEGEALVELELPEPFAAETGQYRLHPALLDLATGAALYAIEGYEASNALYLPLSYRRFTLYERLPAKFLSHARVRDAGVESAVASFDITLLDPSGRVLAAIEEFSMRRLKEAFTLAKASGPVLPEGESITIREEAPAVRAISAALGARAFLRAVAEDMPAQVIIAPQPLEAAGPAVAAPEPPSAGAAGSEVEQVLTGWWRELLGVECAGADDDFFELGGHSLIAVILFSKIRKTYGLELGLATLFEARTIRQIAKLIRETGAAPAARSWPAVVPIQKEGPHPPLFMISGLGGNVLNFQRLSSLLGSNQPLYGLQPPGLDGHKQFLTCIEDLAAFYLGEVKTVQPAGPYYLGGYSFGGLVAFEMAQQLCAAGESIAFLGLFDTSPWNYVERIKRSLRPSERLQLFKAGLNHILFQADGWLYLQSRVRHHGSQGIHHLWKWTGRPGPARLRGIAEINSLAAASYQPKPYPGKITLFRSMERDILNGSDRLLGWGGLAAGGIEVHAVPGTHHNMTRDPHVQVMAAEVGQCLAQAALAAQATAPAAPPEAAPKADTRTVSALARANQSLVGALLPSTLSPTPEPSLLGGNPR